MKFISPIFSELRGTLGGAVGSVARGGVNYLRARVIPTNPSSLLQTAIRSAVQSVSSLWQNVLTELQQDGWFLVAPDTQQGKTVFAQVNQGRIYSTNTNRVTDIAGGVLAHFPTYFADAPEGGLSTPFNLATLPVVDDSANTLSIGTVPDGDWNADAAANPEPAAAIYVFVSGPQLPSRTVRQRPYQLVRAYTVVSPGPQATTPINLAALGIPTVVDRIFYVKVYGQDPYGRTSLPLEYRVTCIA